MPEATVSCGRLRPVGTRPEFLPSSGEGEVEPATQ
jgi:hypothetical protein